MATKTEADPTPSLYYDGVETDDIVIKPAEGQVKLEPLKVADYVGRRPAYVEIGHYDENDNFQYKDYMKGSNLSYDAPFTFPFLEYRNVYIKLSGGFDIVPIDEIIGRDRSNAVVFVKVWLEHTRAGERTVAYWDTDRDFIEKYYSVQNVHQAHIQRTLVFWDSTKLDGIYVSPDDKPYEWWDFDEKSLKEVV
jgi:hypothetical protein